MTRGPHGPSNELERRSPSPLERPRTGKRYLLAVASLWVVPAVVALAANVLADLWESSSLRPAASDLVVVGERQDSDATAVDISIVVAQGTAVLSPGSGVVTATHVSAGQPIEQGAPLIAVNYQDVLVYPSATPLYRDLGRGDRGRDVRALGDYLSAIGLMSSDDISDTYDSRFVAAVRRLQERIGAKPDGHFSLTYVAYVDPGMTNYSPLKTQVGAQVSPGQELIAGRTVAVSASFKPSSTSRSLESFVAQKVVVRAAGVDVAISDISSVTAEEADSLLGLLDDAATAGAVSRISSADGESFSGAVVMLQDPPTYGAVPATAVYLNSEGEACVFVRSEDSRFSPVAVTDVGSSTNEVGIVLLSADLVGRKVARDVAQVAESIRDTC